MIIIGDYMFGSNDFAASLEDMRATNDSFRVNPICVWFRLWNYPILKQ